MYLCIDCMDRGRRDDWRRHTDILTKDLTVSTHRLIHRTATIDLYSKPQSNNDRCTNNVWAGFFDVRVGNCMCSSARTTEPGTAVSNATLFVPVQYAYTH